MDENKSKLIVEHLSEVQESSIELSESARGVWSVSVKAYGRTVEDIQMKLAKLLAIALASKPIRLVEHG